jgi:topoisomerase IV subunit A
LFITEADGSYVELATTYKLPMVTVKFGKEKGKDVPEQNINLVDFVEVRGMKAKGNRISALKVKEVTLIESADEQIASPLPYEGASGKTGKPAEIDDVHLERIRAIKAELDDMDTQMTIDF